MKKVTVTVVVDKWGTHKKGDTLELPLSTARAVAKHGKIEYDGMADEDEHASETGDTSLKVKAAIAIKAIEKMDSVDEIETYTENDERTSVIKAASDRIAELTAE
jgi:hypothetical protein